MTPAAAAPANPAPASPAPVNPTPSDPAKAEALMQELSHDLMSPYCPGRTIATCPSPQARKLEQHILDQALAGKSRVEIETGLVARFPDIQGYLGRPEILYGVGLVALLAIVGVTMAARRWVGRAAAAAPARPAGSAAPAPTDASRRENDALDDALGRIDEF